MMKHFTEPHCVLYPNYYMRMGNAARFSENLSASNFQQNSDSGGVGNCSTQVIAVGGAK
jgi:hypothetical protein